jgi:hypothetical protein
VRLIFFWTAPLHCGQVGSGSEMRTIFSKSCWQPEQLYS